MSVIDKIVSRYTPDIDTTIQNLLSQTPYFIQGIINYHFGWVDRDFKPANFERGKMFRPTMSLLVFEAITGNYQDALPVAAAIEMIHNFSLMHDDIEDGDLERRGRPTAWAIWGKPQVINAGDYLYTLAYRSLYQLDRQRFSAEQIFAVLSLITDACLALTEGQDLDLQFETLKAVSTEMYLDMIYKKTGALVEASIVSGAKLGTSDQQMIQNYYQFAHNIGIAFQIRDDILGIWGDTSKTGKSAVNDLRRKKKTLPVIYTVDQSSGVRREKLSGYYSNIDPLSDDEIEYVRESLEWAEAYEYSQQVADEYRNKAFQALDQIDITHQAQTDLRTIAEFLIDRSY